MVFMSNLKLKNHLVVLRDGYLKGFKYYRINAEQATLAPAFPAG